MAQWVGALATRPEFELRRENCLRAHWYLVTHKVKTAFDLCINKDLTALHHQILCLRGSVKNLPTTHKVLGLLRAWGAGEKSSLGCTPCRGRLGYSTLTRHTPISAKAEDQRWRQNEKLRVSLELKIKAVWCWERWRLSRLGYFVAILKETKKHSLPTQKSKGLV